MAPWAWSLLGLGLSLAIMLAFGIKWKLPLRAVLLGGGAAAAAAGALVAAVLLPPTGAIGGWRLAAALGIQVALSLLLAGGLLMIAFGRDPERTPPQADGIVLSAADGVVRYVQTAEEGSLPLASKKGRDYLLGELTGMGALATGAHVIGVEMSFLNVHVNRCPIAGRVTRLQRIGGGFMSLRQEEAPFVNERVTTVIEGAVLTIATVQIASRLVRRIESYLQVGQAVAAGQRLGMIRLGSLVAVVLPCRDDVAIAVKPGDEVMAGISILARYGETRS